MAEHNLHFYSLTCATSCVIRKLVKCRERLKAAPKQENQATQGAPFSWTLCNVIQTRGCIEKRDRPISEPTYSTKIPSPSSPLQLKLQQRALRLAVRQPMVRASTSLAPSPFSPHTYHNPTFRGHAHRMSTLRGRSSQPLIVK